MTDLSHAIAAHVLRELRHRSNADEAGRAEYIAVLIASEYPSAGAEVVKQAIDLVNTEIRSGALRPVESLRPIEPINIAGLDIDEPENGEPICERVDPRSLFVDPLYQRNVGERGLRLIRQIVENYDWNKFEPPSCTYAEHDGRTVLKVFDGQHTAIAAASHPAITEIPVMIHEARETAQQAAAFVGQNTGKLAVTALQLHQAALVAGDEDAQTVAQVCQKAGVTILRFSQKKFEAGETVAIQAINKLVDQRGAMKARIILEVLVKAGMAPIVSPQIKAIEALLTDPEYCNEVTAESITAAIAGNWLADHDAAKQLALTHKWPFWKALAITWFRNTKKTRKAA